MKPRSRTIAAVLGAVVLAGVAGIGVAAGGDSAGGSTTSSMSRHPDGGPPDSDGSGVLVPPDSSSA